MTKPAEFIVTSAIEVTQNNNKFYLCAISAKDLAATARVNQRDPAKDTGYQRLFADAHIAKIRKYFEAGKCIPASLLVTFKGATFSKGKIRIKRDPNSGWIIDGQHRWLAAQKVNTEIMLPVIAFIRVCTQ